MKKTLAIILCLVLAFLIVGSCFAESAMIETGEIKSDVSDLGASADYLFKTNKNRAICVVMLLFDLSDKLGNGPLDTAKLLSPVKYSCWIGITNDNKDLIVISPFDEKESIITIDYNPKGIVKYYIQENTYTSDEELTEHLPELFAQYKATEYYEILPDEIISTFSSLGVTISSDK